MVDRLSLRSVPYGLWASAEPVIPKFRQRRQGGGTAPVDDRAVFTAIVYVPTSRCGWRELPPSFGVTDHSGETFVFLLTEPAKIAHARRILDDEENVEIHVRGLIAKRSVDYNRPWSYHLRPESVEFFSQMFEICDATIPYVEALLDEAGGAFLPGGHWCPWTSRLTRELPRS